MAEELISVILPVYNIEKYLEKCMSSLFCQTYSNLEFVIVDDGSAKVCADLCDAMAERDSRVSVYHKKNGGLSDARNYGIERARGEYITCIDPDDYVDNDYIEYLYKVLKKYDCKMSICQHRVRFDNSRCKENGANGDEALTTERCLERMLYHDVIDTSAWAKLYHRSLFETVKYPFGKLYEDIGTTYALMMQCDRIAVGYESKYNYIFHNNSIVNGEFKRSKLDLLEMTDQMAAHVSRAYPKLQKAVQRRQVYARLSTLNQMLDTSQCQEEKAQIIAYILRYKKEILSDEKSPKRDKIAVLLLNINYGLYRACWKVYLRLAKGMK